MYVQHITQPPGSSICGQCCIAMLAGTNINDIINRFGNNPTTAKKLKEIANHYNVQLSGVVRTYRKAVHHPPAAILMLRKNKVKTGHWVLKVYDTVYDPSGLIYKYHPGFKITGYSLTGFMEVIAVKNSG